MKPKKKARRSGNSNPANLQKKLFNSESNTEILRESNRVSRLKTYIKQRWARDFGTTDLCLSCGDMNHKVHDCQYKEACLQCPEPTWMVLDPIEQEYVCPVCLGTYKLDNDTLDLVDTGKLVLKKEVC